MQSSTEPISAIDSANLAKLTWKGNISCGPFSFADPTDKIDTNCPPPLYFYEQTILENLPTDKTTLFQGFELNSDGAQKLTD